jgi:hypothetical protein
MGRRGESMEIVPFALAPLKRGRKSSGGLQRRANLGSASAVQIVDMTGWSRRRNLICLILSTNLAPGTNLRQEGKTELQE